MERRTTRFRPDMVVTKIARLEFASRADVAELVDAHGSGPCGGNPVEVQVLSSASSSGAGVLLDKGGFSVPNQRPKPGLCGARRGWQRDRRTDRSPGRGARGQPLGGIARRPHCLLPLVPRAPRCATRGPGAGRVALFSAARLAAFDDGLSAGGGLVPSGMGRHRRPLLSLRAESGQAALLDADELRCVWRRPGRRRRLGGRRLRLGLRLGLKWQLLLVLQTGGHDSLL